MSKCDLLRNSSLEQVGLCYSFSPGIANFLPASITSWFHEDTGCKEASSDIRRQAFANFLTDGQEDGLLDSHPDLSSHVSI